jgi:hypothetical protein
VSFYEGLKCFDAEARQRSSDPKVDQSLGFAKWLIDKFLPPNQPSFLAHQLPEVDPATFPELRTQMATSQRRARRAPWL